jgi:hypothetical protein
MDYRAIMSVGEIEAAVKKLPEQDLKRFREWFTEFDSQLWDRQFESDVKAGKLDRFAKEALDDLAQGRCRDL